MVYKPCLALLTIHYYNLPKSSAPDGVPTFSRRRCKSFSLKPSGGE
ncbi:hypothetical protein HanXRQr2_Chr06g0266151 [Helianthus annuus]|uniref:Uncharacterized protein n=1 Tax=Helianthus annuus TaxID=4232 RepID=A0A9K3IUJ0_HELAN|nr:hypothetical protein HanXRQr2_Chr06g0266151 [Helianthus annuus]